MKSELAQTLTGIAAKASPPVAVLAGAAAGIDWQEWVWIATFCWIALQSAKLLWDWIGKPLWAKRRKD